MNSTSFQPKAVFFTCMDSRMIPTRFTETNVGDMFVGECLYSLQDFERTEFLHQTLINELCVSNITDTKWPIGMIPYVNIMTVKTSPSQCFKFLVYVNLRWKQHHSLSDQKTLTSGGDTLLGKEGLFPYSTIVDYLLGPLSYTTTSNPANRNGRLGIGLGECKRERRQNEGWSMRILCLAPP